MSDSVNFSSRRIKIDDNWVLVNDDYYCKKSNPHYQISKPTYKDDESQDIIYYLKYKRDLLVNDDCINFSIKYFMKHDSRLFVYILGNDVKNKITHKFIYYTSISDGSYWRFCVKDSDESKGVVFYKGYNFTFYIKTLKN